MNYYNDHDPFACQWMRNLIRAGHLPQGDVDERPIEEVQTKDLGGYVQHHFCAGIGGWSLALDLAGWPRERSVCTISCPCQPFSQAGKQKGHQDKRHLWPVFLRLAREQRFATIFGEQVDSPLGRCWISRVQSDLEEAGYAVGRVTLCSAGVGSPNLRHRLYWVAYRTGDSGRLSNTERNGRGERSSIGEGSPGRIHEEGDRSGSPNGGDVDGVASATGERRDGKHALLQSGRIGDLAETSGGGEVGAVRLDSANLQGPQRYGVAQSTNGEEGSLRRTAGSTESASLFDNWDDFLYVYCRDQRVRRISAQPGDEPLAPRISAHLGRGKSLLDGVARNAKANRKGRLAGYGNAINPYVGALWIRSFLMAEADGFSSN